MTRKLSCNQIQVFIDRGKIFEGIFGGTSPFTHSLIRQIFSPQLDAENTYAYLYTHTYKKKGGKFLNFSTKIELFVEHILTGYLPMNLNCSVRTRAQLMCRNLVFVVCVADNNVYQLVCDTTKNQQNKNEQSECVRVCVCACVGAWVRGCVRVCACVKKLTKVNTNLPAIKYLLPQHLND